MNLLLDTHVFIWLDDEAEKLSDSVRDAIQDDENTIYLSIVSIWEMQIKSDLGKLTFSLSIQEKVAGQQKQNGMIVLPVLQSHVYGLSELGNHHRDPFDRLLIAQARYEGMTLVTADPQVQAYTVTTLW
ncbi:MAG: type II toxin-antitoxin system VapC family toxin [Chloroflexota bacterium]